MSDIRIEALRLAASISSDITKVVDAAQKFYEFLSDASSPSSPPAASTPETTKVTPAETVKEPVTQTTKVEEVDINTRVQALAKALIKKDRPKLIEVLKELGFPKASVITADKLPEAEKLFTQALA